MKKRLPSDWSHEGVSVIERWVPMAGDDADLYVRGEKVSAVVEYYNGLTIRFNYVKRHSDGRREVVGVTHNVRHSR